MLKFLFALLLLANAALFAYHQGYIAPPHAEVHEPARVNRQLNADRLRVLPASAADAAVPMKKTSAAAATCSEFGSFDAAEAKRFEESLGPLSLGERLSRHELDEPSRYIVFIPPQGRKEGADRKAGELKKMGVKDFYVVQEGELKWGISLGIFRSEEAARGHLVALNQKGVRSARIGPYAAAPNKVVFRLRNLDGKARAGVDKIMADFPQQQEKACEAGPSA